MQYSYPLLSILFSLLEEATISCSFILSGDEMILILPWGEAKGIVLEDPQKGLSLSGFSGIAGNSLKKQAQHFPKDPQELFKVLADFYKIWEKTA